MHHLKKLSRESMHPNPPSKVHVLAMRMQHICRFATCKFLNLKKESWPPFPNPGYTPEHYTIDHDLCFIKYEIKKAIHS